MNHAPSEDVPAGPRPGPHVTSARLLDRWDDDRWRAPLLAVALAVLTLPAVAMVLVGLLVLAVQGVATWLVVTAAALVTTLLGTLGALAALRRARPGVVHRLGVLSWVWGVAVVVLAVVLALQLEDAPERVAVAVLLVLGGTYTVVLGLALWGAGRVMPAAAEPAGGDGDDVRPGNPSGGPSTVDDVPTQASAPDDDELADWPEWGGSDPRGTEGRGTDGRGPDGRGTDGRGPDGRGTGERENPGTAQGRNGTTVPAPLEDVVDAEVVEPGPPAGRRTPAVPARRPTAPVAPASADRPRRRSVTSNGPGSGRVTRSGTPAPTERIARQDGDDGPPTQRLPPVEL